LEECRYNSTHSLTSALDGGEWSALRSGRFTPREKAPGTHWIIPTKEYEMGWKCSSHRRDDKDIQFCSPKN